MISIILDNETYTDEEMLQILDYCQSDIHELNALHKAMTQQFSRLLDFKRNRTNFPKYMEGAMQRGMYAARSALMEKVGYPVNVEALTNFAGSVIEILSEVQSDINEKFPEIEAFSYNSKTMTWKTNVKKYVNGSQLTMTRTDGFLRKLQKISLVALMLLPVNILLVTTMILLVSVHKMVRFLRLNNL